MSTHGLFKKKCKFYIYKKKHFGCFLSEIQVETGTSGLEYEFIQNTRSMNCSKNFSHDVTNVNTNEKHSVIGKCTGSPNQNVATFKLILYCIAD